MEIVSPVGEVRLGIPRRNQSTDLALIDCIVVLK